MCVVSIGQKQYNISKPSRIIALLKKHLNNIPVQRDPGSFSDAFALKLIQATLDDRLFEGALSLRRIEIAAAEHEFFGKEDEDSFILDPLKNVDILENGKYPFSLLVEKCMPSHIQEIFLPLFVGGIFNRMETAELLLECSRHAILTDLAVDCIILKHIKELEKRGISFPVSSSRRERLDCYREAAKSLSVRAIFLAEVVSKDFETEDNLCVAA